MQTTLSPDNVTPTELSHLETLGSQLPEGDLKTALRGISESLRTGELVFVADEEAALTTTEAARFLGISRPHLYKILDSGALAFHTVGNRDRRIPVAALAAYRDRIRRAREHVAAVIAESGRTEDAAFNEMR